MRIQNRNNKTKKRSLILIGIISAVILLGAGAFYFGYLRSYNSDPATGKDASDPYDKIDYSPADDTDKAYNDQIKQNLGNESRQQNGQDKKAVSLTIVDASQYGSSIEVRAFANEVVESDGKCTVTFTQNSQTITRSVNATAGAQNTMCANVVIPRSEFPSGGAWQLTVSYDSAQATGQSKKEVTLQ